jgi:S-DNA-T family DNA segregation ATPase FtsK/SpoIIIE
MLDRPRLARNGRGLALLFSCAFLVLSLLSYDPADSPGANTAPPNIPPKNLCGPVGAFLSHFLMASVGWASLVVLFGMIVADLLIFRRREIPERAVRLAGFALLIFVAATAIQALAPGIRLCHAVGPGGYIGAIGRAFLIGQFGPVGTLLILTACGLIAIAMSYDFLFVWPFQELLAVWESRRGASPRPGDSRPSYESPLSIETMPRALETPAYRPAHSRQALNSEPRPNLVIHGQRSANRSQTALAGPPIPEDGSFRLPPREMLEPPPAFAIQEHEAKIHARALLLEKTLLEHGCQVRVVQIDTGPVITQFEIELEAGLRVSKVAGLSNDLAIALAVPSVRIVAPIPGKTTVGIEVPNERRGMVKLGEIIESMASRLDKFRIPLFLGKDVKGEALAFDLADMPHLLIAGRTGTGKSVCLNAMILSILMTRRPDEVKLLLIDPKMVELSQFKRIPHLMHPVVTDMKKAESLLSWACDKMDERYGFLQRAGVRNVQSYNALGPDEILNRVRPESDEEAERVPTYMPYIVIIADEMSDLMMTAAKEVESHIVRLAQKARAAGIHLILATQRPTVDVITGLIKGNMPARISFQVTSRNDSRVVLDEMGADKLLGNGDMLFLVPGTSHIVRAQGTYVSDAEVNRVCAYLEQYPVEFSKELVAMPLGGSAGKDRAAALKERDELYEPAIEIIIREGRGSTSLLQRALGIGYGRAARLIDFMAEDGIVGEFKSGSAREVLYNWDEWEAMKNGGDAGPGSG